jgi:hypothetical protein
MDPERALSTRWVLEVVLLPAFVGPLGCSGPEFTAPPVSDSSVADGDS